MKLEDVRTTAAVIPIKSWGQKLKRARKLDAAKGNAELLDDRPTDAVYRTTTESTLHALHCDEIQWQCISSFARVRSGRAPVLIFYLFIRKVLRKYARLDRDRNLINCSWFKWARLHLRMLERSTTKNRLRNGSERRDGEPIEISNPSSIRL